MPVDLPICRHAKSTAQFCTGGIYSITAMMRGNPMIIPITQAEILIILDAATFATLHYGMNL